MTELKEKLKNATEKKNLEKESVSSNEGLAKDVVLEQKEGPFYTRQPDGHGGRLQNLKGRVIGSKAKV